MPKINKTTELIGYAKIRVKDDTEPETAKILSDGSCWLNDGRVFTLPPEELARFARQIEYKKRDDRLTGKAINIMSPPALDEKPYKDEEDLVKEKKQAQIQKQAAIAKERERRARMERERVELEKKKNKNRLLILLAVLIIAACGFFFATKPSTTSEQDKSSIVQEQEMPESEKEVESTSVENQK